MNRISTTIQEAIARIKGEDIPSTSNRGDVAGNNYNSEYHRVPGDPQSHSTMYGGNNPEHGSAIDMEQSSDVPHHYHSSKSPMLFSNVDGDSIVQTAKDLAVGTFKEGYGWITGDTLMHSEGKEQRMRAAGAPGTSNISGRRI